MTIKMSATELKAKILAVLDRVAEGDEVEVSKHGRPVARIVPMRRGSELRGRFAGVAATVGDDEDLLGTGEAWEAG